MEQQTKTNLYGDDEKHDRYTNRQTGKYFGGNPGNTARATMVLLGLTRYRCDSQEKL
jgi:hypothetical protein